MDLKPHYLHMNKPKVARLLSNVKVVYTDVDGTLLGPDGSLFTTTKGRLSLYPAKALIMLREHNIDIVMVSGRSRKQLFGDARIMGLKNYIAELGCEVIYDLGERVYLNAGNIKVENGNLFSHIKDSKAPELLIENNRGYFEYHTPWSENRECTHVFRGFIDTDEANMLLLENGYDWLQVIDNGIIHRKGNLKKDIPEIHAYHLLPKGGGKESGVKRDLDIRGYSKDQAMAIGDALSDLSLASEVSALFLVSNAFTKNSEKIYHGIKMRDNVFVTPLAMNLGFAQASFELLSIQSRM